MEEAMKNEQQQMMSEKYGKDLGGCLLFACVAAIIVAAIVILFT
jgi:hypothetical protein